MNLGTTRLRGRPRSRRQDEVREDGRIVGGEGWQEKVHNREEWKKLLWTARNHCILHMPKEWMNELKLSLNKSRHCTSDPGHMWRVRATEPVGADTVVKTKSIQSDLEGTNVECTVRTMVVLWRRRLSEQRRTAISPSLCQYSFC